MSWLREKRKKQVTEKQMAALDNKRVEAIKEAQRLKLAEEQMQRVEEYNRLQRKIGSFNQNYGMAQQGLAAIGALPAPGGGGGSHTHSYVPGGGGGASSGGGTYISSSEHVRSSIDVGTLIKQAVEEASKEFKLTVESMQEQIDELWEVIRELEDD